MGDEGGLRVRQCQGLRMADSWTEAHLRVPHQSLLVDFLALSVIVVRVGIIVVVVVLLVCLLIVEVEVAGLTGTDTPFLPVADVSGLLGI